MSLTAFLRARMSTSTSAQLTAPYLRTTLWLLLALLWLPVLAIAAPAAGGSLDLAVRVSPALIAVSVLLSSLSGATALVIRIDRELSAAPDKPLPRPLLFCAAHMLGSWLAGTLAFITAQQQVMDVWLGLGLVIVASFIGAKFVEGAAERYLARVPGLPVIPPATPTNGDTAP